MSGSITGRGNLLVGTNLTNPVDVDIFGTITLPSVTIYSQSLYISGTISTNGMSNASMPGRGSRADSGSGGGSHGGSGGANVGNIVGIPYGSYYSPSLPGSVGGSSAIGMGTYQTKYYFFSLFFQANKSPR